MEILKQMCESTLYTELQEFREDLISLNDVTLSLENPDTTNFSIYANEIKFVAGLHIDRQRNTKELIEKYKNTYSKNYETENGILLERQGDIYLEFYISKVPMKFNSMPLTLILDLWFHTPMKLNVERDGKLMDPEELPLSEWHQVRFEGLVNSKFTNSVQDIVKLKNLFRKQAAILAEGKEMPEVEDWTITNLDHRIDYVNN